MPPPPTPLTLDEALREFFPASYVALSVDMFGRLNARWQRARKKHGGALTRRQARALLRTVVPTLAKQQQRLDDAEHKLEEAALANKLRKIVHELNQVKHKTRMAQHERERLQAEVDALDTPSGESDGESEEHL